MNYGEQVGGIRNELCFFIVGETAAGVGGKGELPASGWALTTVNWPLLLEQHWNWGVKTNGG